MRFVGYAKVEVITYIGLALNKIMLNQSADNVMELEITIELIKKFDARFGY